MELPSHQKKSSKDVITSMPDRQELNEIKQLDAEIIKIESLCERYYYQLKQLKEKKRFLEMMP
jgi:hypothetical protein